MCERWAGGERGLRPTSRRFVPNPPCEFHKSTPNHHPHRGKRGLVSPPNHPLLTPPPIGEKSHLVLPEEVSRVELVLPLAAHVVVEALAREHAVP